jgi:hypothetical protein
MKSYSLAAVLCCLGGLAVADCASAQQLYTNGPFVTHPGAHASGADVSIAQDVTYSGYTALGFTAGPGYRLADDFTVPAGKIWTLNSAVLYAYQTGAGDAAFTDARVIIWSGAPDNSLSTKLFDGSLATVLVSSTPGAYRVAQSVEAVAPFTNTERRVENLLVTISNTDGTAGLQLLPGQYWIDWQLTGPQAGSVYTPPVSIIGQPYTAFNGFARRKNIATNTWELFQNGSAPYLVDLPFLLNGTSFDDAIFASDFETITTTP